MLVLIGNSEIQCMVIGILIILCGETSIEITSCNYCQEGLEGENIPNTVGLSIEMAVNVATEIKRNRLYGGRCVGNMYLQIVTAILDRMPFI